VTPEAHAHLAHEGYDPIFGARPLKRVIQRVIGDNASLLILEGKVAEDGMINVEVQDGRIVLHS
jgi:ATP-dependent Clp protease ATP-binding subunit ClpB